MTEDIKTGMIAINKWFYYSMCYHVVPVEIEDYPNNRTEYMPDCFNAFPKYLRAYLLQKWNTIRDKYGCEAVLMRFYAELDETNRKLLMEWVLNNFNGEWTLKFNEGD